MSLKLKILRLDGSAMDAYVECLASPMERRRDYLPWLKKVPGSDPRYGCIVEAETGRELCVRHSSSRGHRMLIVLKWVDNGRVAEELADYDRRNLDEFYFACRKADRELARMGGLLHQRDGRELKDGRQTC